MLQLYNKELDKLIIKLIIIKKIKRFTKLIGIL